MSTQATAGHSLGELLYFGKLPSRGDFVRSAQHTSLVADLDQWQSRTLERLSTDTRWKLVYDAAPDLSFAIHDCVANLRYDIETREGAHMCACVCVGWWRTGFRGGNLKRHVWSYSQRR